MIVRGRLLSIGKARAGKGACKLAWEDVVEWGEGLVVVLVPGRIDRALTAALRDLRKDFEDRGYLALTRRFSQKDALRLYTLDDLATHLRCSKSTLYALASSKEQLAVRVVTHFFRGAADRI